MPWWLRSRDGAPGPGCLKRISICDPPGHGLFGGKALKRVHQAAQAHRAERFILAGDAGGEQARLQVKLDAGIPLLELDHPLHAVNSFGHGCFLCGRRA
jgi:hypothetical protein